MGRWGTLEATLKAVTFDLLLALFSSGEPKQAHTRMHNKSISYSGIVGASTHIMSKYSNNIRTTVVLSPFKLQNKLHKLQNSVQKHLIIDQCISK